MGQTITEKIFSEHVGKKVYAGEIVRSPIDMVIGNDITTPISIKAFEDGGFEKLVNPDGFAIVLDHFIPAKDIASANQAKISRDFAMKHNLKYFFDEKDMGIEHALLPEKGLDEVLKPIREKGIRDLIRYSGTENKIRLLLEGKNKKDVEDSMETLKSFFKKVL